MEAGLALWSSFNLSRLQFRWPAVKIRGRHNCYTRNVLLQEVCESALSKHTHTCMTKRACVGAADRDCMSKPLVVYQSVSQQQDCLLQRRQQAGKDLILHSWTPAENPASCSMSGSSTRTVTMETRTEMG